MKVEKDVSTRKPFHQKSWLMWLFLFIFPPVGLILLWKQNKFSKVKKIILTVLASIYFITPIIIIVNTTVPLFYNHDDVVEAFTEKVSEQDLSYSMQVIEEEKHLITSELSNDIILLENIDNNDRVQEIIMIGQGSGTDIIHIMGILIEITNPNLEKAEIGEILTKLRLFDENYEFTGNELTVEENLIRYHLKYDESSGVIFSVSKVN